MKKILLSVSIIAAVAAVVFGVTTAFFSDTETSTGNTFTAGSLDLIVDIDGVDQLPELTGPIFTLPDMKPGDLGEKTISLKVDDNPACGFVNIDLTSDLDNTCTEPEGKEAVDLNCADGDGELNDEVQFAIWSDTDCDNVYDPGEVPELVQGPLTGGHVYSIGEIPPTTINGVPNLLAPKCYGIGYCFGTWVVTPVDTNGDTVPDVMKVKCNGALIGNEAQSDSFAASLVITAEQERNQYPNGCPGTGELFEDLNHGDTCIDGVDNDRDGAIDGQDSGCPI